MKKIFYFFILAIVMAGCEDGLIAPPQPHPCHNCGGGAVIYCPTEGWVRSVNTDPSKPFATVCDGYGGTWTAGIQSGTNIASSISAVLNSKREVLVFIDQYCFIYEARADYTWGVGCNGFNFWKTDPGIPDSIIIEEESERFLLLKQDSFRIPIKDKTL